MPKERPILFNGDMVRALLDGRKTQTRRVMKAQPEPTPDDYPGQAGHWFPCHVVQSMVHVERDIEGSDWGLAGTCCPYGDVGDRLWVRETFQGPLVDQEEMEKDPTYFKNMSRYKNPKHCAYRASGDSCEYVDPDGDLIQRWRPSIHMPRWASRITLEIVSVRVERLQDISEADAKAEGVNGEAEAVAVGLEWFDKPRRAFRFLWESISGAGSWEANPWVWVVEFKRVEDSQ